MGALTDKFKAKLTEIVDDDLYKEKHRTDRELARHRDKYENEGSSVKINSSSKGHKIGIAGFNIKWEVEKKAK